MAKAISLYHADTGVYPVTGGWLTNPTALAELVPKYIRSITKAPPMGTSMDRYMHSRCDNGVGYVLFATLKNPNAQDLETISNVYVTGCLPVNGTQWSSRANIINTYKKIMQFFLVNSLKNTLFI